MRSFSRIAKLAAGVALWTGVALADYTLDFNIGAPTPGTISYAGGANPLVGSNIQVDSVVSVKSPVNTGLLLSCQSCTLNFTTGNYDASHSIPGLLLDFAGGGSFTLMGEVLGAGISTPTTLLSGTFGGGTVLDIGPTFKIVGAAISNSIDATLAAFFGLPPSPPQYWGGFNISFFAPNQTNGAFSTANGGAVFSGDLTTSVPEPLSIVLLGTVLLGCAAIARRRAV